MRYEDTPQDEFHGNSIEYKTELTVTAHGSINVSAVAIGYFLFMVRAFNFTILHLGVCWFRCL